MSNKRGIDWSIVDIGARKSRFSALISGETRRGPSVIAITCLVLALSMVLLIVMNSTFGGMDDWIRRSALLSFGLVYLFLAYPLGRKTWSDPLNGYFLVDLALIGGVIFSQIYIMLYLEEIISPFAKSAALFTVVGGFLIFAVLEATRRTFGLVVALVPVVFAVHALLPTAYYGAGISPDFFIDITVNIDTLFGVSLEVMAGELGLFMLFAAIVTQTRTAAVFVALANAIAGHRMGGPAKVAVIGSGMISTITGSSVANVAMMGSVTIPLMKRVGFKPEMAGAIETSASSGGQITPPVMGLVAFIIAGTIGMDYGELSLRVAFPAFLYFFSLYLAVDITARKQNIRRIGREELPQLLPVLIEGGPFLLPVLLVIVVLFLDYSAGTAGLVGCISAIAVSFLKKESRPNPRKIMETVEEFMEGAAPIVVACGLVGVIIGAISASGLATSFTSYVYSLGGGYVLPSLIIIAIAAIILGLGLPIIAVYILLATLVVPAVARLAGVEPLQAHMFVFYYAAASAITPPVCIPAFTAAVIANADPMKTGWLSFMVGFSKHVLPMFFFYKPGLFLYGSHMDIILAFATTTLGIVFLTWIFQNYSMRRNSWYETALLAAGVVLLFPDHIASNIAGAAFGLAVVLWQLSTERMKGANVPQSGLGNSDAAAN